MLKQYILSNKKKDNHYTRTPWAFQDTTSKEVFKPEELKVLNEVTEDINNRAEQYGGHTYWQVSAILEHLLEKVEISALPAEKYFLLTQIVNKLVRYANSKCTHYDSIKDAVAYCALLADIERSAKVLKELGK